MTWTHFGAVSFFVLSGRTFEAEQRNLNVMVNKKAFSIVSGHVPML